MLPVYKVRVSYTTVEGKEGNMVFETKTPLTDEQMEVKVTAEVQRVKKWLKGATIKVTPYRTNVRVDTVGDLLREAVAKKKAKDPKYDLMGATVVNGKSYSKKQLAARQAA